MTNDIRILHGAGNQVLMMGALANRASGVRSGCCLSNGPSSSNKAVTLSTLGRASKVSVKSRPVALIKVLYLRERVFFSFNTENLMIASLVASGFSTTDVHQNSLSKS